MKNNNHIIFWSFVIILLGFSLYYFFKEKPVYTEIPMVPEELEHEPLKDEPLKDDYGSLEGKG